MDLYTVTKYVKFNAEEIKSFVVTAVFLGFMFSFQEWGAESFDVNSGFFNWFNAVIVVAFVMFFYLMAQRIMAIKKGYKVEYKMWFYGLIFSLMITFVTRGNIILPFIGATIIYHLEGHRLGKFRYGLNYKDLGIISLTGPMTALIIGMAFKVFSLGFTQSPLVDKMLIVCLFTACFNMLPLPWIDGGNVFFASRLLWVFSFVTIVAASILIYAYNSIIGVLISAVFVGIVCTIIWNAFIEEGF